MTATSDAGADRPRMAGLASLNHLLQRELMAVETYEHVVQQFAGHPVESELRQIRRDHHQAAGLLEAMVYNLTGEPARGLETSGAAVPHGPDQARPDAVFAALRQAEERAAADYDAFLQAEENPQECRFAIRAQVFPQCHEHIDMLADMATGFAPAQG